MKWTLLFVLSGLVGLNSAIADEAVVWKQKKSANTDGSSALSVEESSVAISLDHAVVPTESETDVSDFSLASMEGSLSSQPSALWVLGAVSENNDDAGHALAEHLIGANQALEATAPSSEGSLVVRSRKDFWGVSTAGLSARLDFNQLYLGSGELSSIDYLSTDDRSFPVSRQVAIAVVAALGCGVIVVRRVFFT